MGPAILGSEYQHTCCPPARHGQPDSPAEPDGLSSGRQGPCPLLSTPNPSRAVGPQPAPPIPGGPLICIPTPHFTTTDSPWETGRERGPSGDFSTNFPPPRCVSGSAPGTGDEGQLARSRRLVGPAAGEPLTAAGGRGRAPVHTGLCAGLLSVRSPAHPTRGPGGCPEGPRAHEWWGAPAETRVLQQRAWGRPRQQAGLWPSQGPSSGSRPAPTLPAWSLSQGSPVHGAGRGGGKRSGFPSVSSPGLPTSAGPGPLTPPHTAGITALKCPGHGPVSPWCRQASVSQPPTWGQRPARSACGEKAAAVQGASSDEVRRSVRGRAGLAGLPEVPPTREDTRL